MFSASIGFETPQSEVDFLRRRLAEEKANTERANAARIEAERRLEAAEKERDVYRVLARRWKTRTQTSPGSSTEDSETIEEAAAAMLLGSRESVSLLGFGNMFRRFRARASAAAAARREESDSESDEEAEQEDNEAFDEDRMEEDDNNGDDMSEDTESGDEEDLSEAASDSFSMSSSHQGSMIDVAARQVKASRSTARTVSLSEDAFLSE